MASDPNTAGARPAWFVGAAFEGGIDDQTDRFSWTSFYSGFADRLLAFRHNRPALLTAISRLPGKRVGYLTDRFAAGHLPLHNDGNLQSKTDMG